MVRPRRRDWTFATLNPTVRYVLAWESSTHRWVVSPLVHDDPGAPRLAQEPPSAAAAGSRAERGDAATEPEARRVGRHRVVASSGWGPLEWA